MEQVDQKTRKYPKKKRNYRNESTTKETTHDQILKVIELSAVATPRELIASSTQLTTSQVDNIINRYKGIYKQLDKLDDLRRVRGELIESTMYGMLESLNDSSCIEAADLKQRAYAFSQTFNAHRLEANKSTANHQHLSITNPKRSLSDVT